MGGIKMASESPCGECERVWELRSRRCARTTMPRRSKLTTTRIVSTCPCTARPLLRRDRATTRSRATRLKNLPSPAMMSTDTSKGTVSATAAPRSAAAYGLHRTSTVHTPPAELSPLYIAETTDLRRVWSSQMLTVEGLLIRSPIERGSVGGTRRSHIHGHRGIAPFARHVSPAAGQPSCGNAVTSFAALEV